MERKRAEDPDPASPSCLSLIRFGAMRSTGAISARIKPASCLSMTIRHHPDIIHIPSRSSRGPSSLLPEGSEIHPAARREIEPSVEIGFSRAGNPLGRSLPSPPLPSPPPQNLPRGSNARLRLTTRELRGKRAAASCLLLRFSVLYARDDLTRVFSLSPSPPPRRSRRTRQVPWRKEGWL
jgi:hypothetical protein